MSDRAELPDDLYARIQSLCAEGDKLSEAKRFDDAIAKYNSAWMLVPEPKQDWNASTWILAAIGDACFLGGYAISALEAFQFAMHCPGAIGNPFLHLRLGQLLLDKERPDEAADELARAYMGGGAEIFADENPRYMAFLKTRMVI